jgi:hypothetical protein
MTQNDRAPSDDDADMMLAAGRLGGPAKDRIFEAVMDQVEPRRGWLASVRAKLAAGMLVAVTATAALLIVPRLRPDELTAKGPAGGQGPSLDLSCTGGALTACPAGARLLFVVEGAPDGYLAAWAEPVSGGERIWYFSRESQSPALAPVAGTQVAPKAIQLGPEHAPGEYLVHVLVTRTPLSREELRQISDPLAQRRFSLRVVP